MRKTYRLRSWRGWDKHIDACVTDFVAEFGVEPNLLVANGVTLRRFNLAADKAKMGNTKGGVPDPVSYAEVQGFAGIGYQLVFIEEGEVEENHFALIRAMDETGAHDDDV